MSILKIEPIICGQTVTGCGLHWNCCNQNLYFIDLYGPSIFRYDPIKNETFKTTIENESTASFIIPIQNNPEEFAIGLDAHVGIIEWDGCAPTCKVTSIILQVETDYLDNRFNVAEADTSGRFVGGTMRSEKSGNIFDVRRGKLYKLDKNGQKPIILKDNIGIPSGITWYNNTFYFIDSCDYNIKEYEYCRPTGQISNPKVLHEFRSNENERPKCLPCGMTIDSSGFLYVAGNGGSVIYIINPDNGDIEREIKMPCAQITSVAFGGPNLDILFATTIEDDCEMSGETYKITGLGVKGLPMNNLKI